MIFEIKGEEMQRRIANRYFKEIIKALNECELKFQKKPTLKSGGKRVGVEGWYGDGVIVIKNTKHTNLALVMIHETLHHLYPDWPEIDCEGEPIELFAHSLLCAFSTTQTNAILSFVPKIK